MGSKPAPMPAPVITMPANTAPMLTQTINPQRSYQDLAAAAKRLDKQIAGFEKARTLQGYDSESMGERDAALRLQEAAAYRASLPGDPSRTDRGFMPVYMDKDDRPTFTKPSGTGTAAPMDYAKAAAGERYDVMKRAFDAAKAQKAKGEKDPSFVDPDAFDPSWAQVPDETFALKGGGKLKNT